MDGKNLVEDRKRTCDKEREWAGQGNGGGPGG